MKKLLVAVAAVAALTGSALAADIPAPAPAYKAPAMVSAPRMSWTGCYVGVGGGYGMWNQEHTTYDIAGLAVPFSNATHGGRGRALRDGLTRRRFVLADPGYSPPVKGLVARSRAVGAPSVTRRGRGG